MFVKHDVVEFSWETIRCSNVDLIAGWILRHKAGSVNVSHIFNISHSEAPKKWPSSLWARPRNNSTVHTVFGLFHISVVQTSEIKAGMLPALPAPLGFLAFTVIGIFLKRPHIIGPVLEINCRVKEPLNFWSRPHAVYGDFVCSNKLAN